MFADAFLQGIGAFGFMMRSKVLMTTRLTPRAVERYGQFLQGVREEELKEMKKEDAVAFFHAQGIRGTHTEIEAACEPYGYHPLSLRILAGLIVNDRNAPGDISAAKNLEITGDIIQSKHHVLETAFNTLSPPQKSLLGRVACFRAPTSYDALKTIQGSGQGNDFLDASLKALESRGLVHWDRKANKYDLHSIVRRFAYDRLTASDRTAAHTRLANYFEAIPKLEKVNTLEDLAPVIELYHHMVRAGNLDEACDLFYDRINIPTFYQFGAYQLRIELFRALFPDGEDNPPRLKKEGDQAWTLNGLANTYALSGQPRRAVPLFEMTNDIYEKTGTKKNLAIGLGNVAGMAQIYIGALSAAERNLRRQIDLCREIADENHEGTGHYELGRVLVYIGQWEKSEKALNTGEEIKKKTNHIQAQSVIWSYRALRLLLMAREEAIFDTQQAVLDTRYSKDESRIPTNEYRQSAIEFAQRTLELADETAKPNSGFVYPIRDYVRAHWLLGAAYRANNDLTLAEENLSKALNLCRQINLVEVEANILLDLARLRYAQGDFKDAQEKASEALTITERSGYVLQGADVNLFLATLALEGHTLERFKFDGKRELSEKEVATLHAKEALRLAHCDDGPPYYYKVAYEEAERMLEQLK
jgi:tetratricopeptide (TPR) repeat protein